MNSRGLDLVDEPACFRKYKRVFQRFKPCGEDTASTKMCDYEEPLFGDLRVRMFTSSSDWTFVHCARLTIILCDVVVVFTAKAAEEPPGRRKESLLKMRLSYIYHFRTHGVGL